MDNDHDAFDEELLRAFDDDMKRVDEYTDEKELKRLQELVSDSKGSLKNEDLHRVCDKAIRYDFLACLKFCEETGYCQPTSCSVLLAAKCGSFKCLRHMVDQNCSYNAMECAAFALRGGFHEIVSFLDGREARNLTGGKQVYDERTPFGTGYFFFPVDEMHNKETFI